MASKQCKDHLGNCYDSYYAMASAWNIEYRTLLGRLNKGMSIKEVLTTPVPHSNKGVKYDHLMNPFQTYKEMAEAWKIPYNIFKSRLDAHWDMERALTTQARVVYDHKGNPYPGFSTMCKAYNKSPETVKLRLDKGFSLEEALTIPSSERATSKPIVIPGKGTFHNAKTACKQLGINYRAYQYRLESGMTREQALGLTGNISKKAVILPGIGEYTSKRECCKELGISDVSIRSQSLKHNITYEQAAIKLFNEKSDTSVEAFGTKYKTLRAAAIAYNAVRETVRHRVEDNGMDIEVALIYSSSPNDKWGLAYVGLDGISRYRVGWSRELVTARQIISRFRPDLLPQYDSSNPTGSYNPYRKDGEV